MGTVEVKVNGTSVIGPLSSQDTKNAGTKTVLDTVRIAQSVIGTTKYDDMYVAMGGGESFRGSQTLSALSAAALARQSARVALPGRHGGHRHHP